MTIITRIVREQVRKKGWRSPDPLIILTLAFFVSLMLPVIIVACYAIHTGWKP